MENYQLGSHDYSLKAGPSGHYWVFIDYVLMGVLRTAFHQGQMMFQVIGKDEYFATREAAAASLVPNVT